jgi:putative flippase GtrA
MNPLPRKIAFLYICCAGFSMLINICIQMISISLYTKIYAIEVSILAGTLSGLPLRYFLEKQYIFSYQAKNLKHDVALFLPYCLTSILTTLIFWGFEYSFHKLFDHNFLRYVGGIIGLSIGFYIKYELDKKFIFIANDNRAFIR